MLDLETSYDAVETAIESSRKALAAIPLPGRSLGAVVERLGAPVHQAVASIHADLKAAGLELDWLLGGLAKGPGARCEEDALRASWIVVSILLLHSAKFGGSKVDRALEWFFSGTVDRTSLSSSISSGSIRALNEALQGFESQAEIGAYLPYVLEPHGHVTRGRLERTASGPATRRSKRESGVFYTPADISEFLVQELTKNTSGNETWCDPACGTGVFLRAALSRMCKSAPKGQDSLGIAVRQIFGADVSAIALEMAGMVILLDCLVEGATPPESPFRVWRTLGRNLVCMDALHGLRGRFENADSFTAIAAVGFDRLVLNPPYGNQAIDRALRKNWLSLSSGASNLAPIQLAFVEMMWRLTKPNGSAGAVLPLSVASNTQKVHRAFRQHIAELPGKKDFLFFDREPQSLFGEDVKTRNSLMFLDKGMERAFFTSSLLKWTAVQRPGIFSRARLVPLGPLELGSGIPRLGSNAEVMAYRRLKQGYALASTQDIGSLSYNASRSLPLEQQRRTLLIGPTAYNYVNCFPANALAEIAEDSFSASSLHAITFLDRTAAIAAFSVFSSRICYWLWRVEGDGFHLSREFVSDSPLWRTLDCPSLLKPLSTLGAALWEGEKVTKVRSVNAGRVSYAFSPGFESPDALEVERLLLDFFGIEREFSEELSRVVSSSVSIDGRHRSRANGAA